MRRRKRKLGTAALVLSCFLAGAGAGSGGDSVRPKPIQVAGGAGPLFSLRERLELRASYTGSAEGRAALESNQVRPLALISADFDEDGVADVICGYSGPVAGVLSLYSGNVYSIYPNTPAARERRRNAPAARDYVPAPFLSTANVFDLPFAPDFLAAGDFDADAHFDVAAASRGGKEMVLLPGDGKGGFGRSRAINLPGAVTALAAGEINRRDGLTDVVVAIAAADGPRVLVFESPTGALTGPPETIALPAEATALAFGQLDEDYSMDLAVAAGRELLVIHGRDRKLSLDEKTRAAVPPAEVSKLPLSFRAASIAIGDFAGGRESEIALLAEDGSVHLLQRESKASDFKLNAALALPSGRASPRGLVGGRFLGLAKDDLLVVDGGSDRVRLLMGEDGSEVSFSAGGRPAAVLPMRLNSDALLDLVILTDGHSASVVAASAPAATFVVDSTGDQGGGLCDGSEPCTLRSAVEAANASPGADAIVFDIPGGTPQTIHLTSDLTVTDSVTIDGTTQPGFAGTPVIELSGPAPSGATLLLGSGSSTVRGLVLNRGLRIRLQEPADGNLIEGNFMGTDVTGTIALPSPAYVSISSSSGNLIGGTTAEARNVILGGISLWDDSDLPMANLIQGNYIGTDVSGTVGLAAGSGAGVSLQIANGNMIGGTAPGAGNVISALLIGIGIVSSEPQSSAADNLIQGNLIGTNAAGTGALGNEDAGLYIEACRNTIGGTTSAARNIIAGNGGDGVLIQGDLGPSNNIVEGNYIGTDVTGLAALGNAANGVSTEYLAYEDIIGGTSPGAGNVISGNGGRGLRIDGGGAVVQGNLIGTGATGLVAVGNAMDGVLVERTSTRIGGTSPGSGNVISGNLAAGVRMAGYASNWVQGNYIGTDVTGSSPLGNAQDGVVVEGSGEIGGSFANARNVISGNLGSGIHIDGGVAGVYGNYIGVDRTGTVALGNAGDGVRISATSSEIGGTAPGEGNLIAFNGGAGVNVLLPPGATTTANLIGANTMHSNGGLGIDLGGDGVTANDPLDADAGANGLQNYPVLTAVGAAASTTIKGSLNSVAGGTYTIDFYSNVSCDSSGFGEGQVYLGKTTVQTDANGGGSFVVVFPVGGLLGQFITATATNSGDSTSEFSQCAQVAGPVPPSAVSVEPTSGTGPSQRFTYLFTDPDGFADMTNVRMLINSGLSGRNGCYILYDRAASELFLRDDANTEWLGPIAPFSPYVLQNSQCWFSGSWMGIAGEGDDLTIAINLRFEPAFSGRKTNCLMAQDTAGKVSGWHCPGSWTVNFPPSSVSVTPSSGTGSTQLFTYLASDTDEFADIATMEMMISRNEAAVNACYVLYNRAPNRLFLRNDANTAWLGPVIPGVAGSVENGQCAVDGGASSAVGSGNNLTVQAALAFKSGFAGFKQNRMRVAQKFGTVKTSGWKTVGHWTVP